MSTVKPFAFVLMPFEPAFDDIYKLAIQAAAAEVGIIAERVDEQRFTETILERVYRQIRQADFIVADMTGRNANVFYEVGYSHAHDKLCTLLTQREDDIPFDLKHHRHIIYGSSVSTLKQQLVGELAWLKKECLSRANPIVVELKDSWADLEKHESYGVVQATMQFVLFNRTNKRSPDIEAIYLITGKSWGFKQGGDACPSLADEGEPHKLRHFIKPPVPRLSPSAWAQVQVEGSRWVFPKLGEKLKDDYQFKGMAWIEIVTSEGTYSSGFELNLDTTELPF